MPGDSVEAPGHRPRSQWALLLVLAAVQFTHILDFMLLMPLGPRYLRELEISPGQFGLLVSAYAASACVAGILAALWVDRFDRKRPCWSWAPASPWAPCCAPPAPATRSCSWAAAPPGRSAASSGR